jgi:type VI secretion system protein ImpL
VDRFLVPSFILLLAVAICLISVAVILLSRSRPKGAQKDEPNRAGRQLSDSFRSSLSILQAKLSDKDFFYRVPWVLTLGESSSGKTSLLRQLDAQSSGSEADGEWFFLQHGAMLDVPGDFLIGKDGTSATDGRWKKLLRLLVRHRSHRPVDGIVLTIPAPSVIGSNAVTDAQRILRASAIRNQLDQLQRELRMVVPIYVLITKCDQVRGFSDFSEQLDPASHDQMFGWSSASTLETSYSPERVDEAFSSFALRLLELQLGMFAREVRGSVDDLFLFPGELERMREPVKEYLKQIFQETSYVEANFLRGIYFCGEVYQRTQVLSAVPALASGTTEMALAAPGGPLISDHGAVHTIDHESTNDHRIAFVRHLLDLKVFPEAKIARPTRGILLTRDRGLIGTQLALVVFILVFSIGTGLAYFRLSYFSQHRLQPALDIVASRFPQSQAERNNYSVSAAYDLVDLLGEVDVEGFRAVFFPASWTDPVNKQIAATLADAFSRRVLIAFKNELTERVKKAKGSCRPLSMAPQKLSMDVDALAERRFENDLEYQQLEQSLSDMDQLRKAVATYNDLRLAGRGSFQDLNLLFNYLIHKSLDDESRFRHNPYYVRAMQAQSAGPVELQNPLDHQGDFEACMAVQTESRVDNFFASWFGENNPLGPLTNGVAEEIDGLATGAGQTREKLRFLVDDVRRLDALVSSGAYRWLREPNFDMAAFPAIAKGVSAEPFADPAFLERVKDSGTRAFVKLKDNLFSVTTAPTGYVLVDMQGEIKVDPEVNTAAANIDILSTQDFMADPVAAKQLIADRPVIWHKDALGGATQLIQSYQTYLKEKVPLIPSGLRSSIQAIALAGLRASVLAAVANAEEPVNTGVPSSSALMLQIRSFDESLPVLTQIAAALGGSASADDADLDRVVLGQATLLSQELTRLFKSEAFYTTAQSALAGWDGMHPLSLLRFGADTPEDLEVYLAKQRELLKAFSLNYALPLEQYLQAHKLQDVNGLDVWPGIIRDVQDYEANKPGNPLSLLETFLRSGMDKITIPNACQAVVAGTPSANYFLTLRAKLQKSAVDRCGEILLSQYNSKVADFFNQRLAGKFPFGPSAGSADKTEADPNDMLTFLREMNQFGAPLMQYLEASNRQADVQAFLRNSEAISEFFKGGLAEGTLYVDSTVAFRVNSQAEMNGDHIIEWKVQAGDATISMGEAANGLRWTYGTPIVVTLRFAKDSPDIPVAGAGGVNTRTEGRTVSYEFRDPWALFRLIEEYGGKNADYGTSDNASTLRFVIPTASDPAHAKAQGTLKPQRETRVFARLRFYLAGGKEPRETPIPAFPASAPLIPGLPALNASN